MAAAANRRLQKEVETTLKKVDDGLEEFTEYWDLAQNASSHQQKERAGEELKKSINKLQRFRSQIREWLAQAGGQQTGKDKLEEARRKIESDMARFKDFERELKTKAFSTCALTRGDEPEDEAEKAKEWLTHMIQQLNDQLDLNEADLEALSNKKSLSSDDKSRQQELKALQERHQWHIKKLEQLLRALDNDAVDFSCEEARGNLQAVKDSLDTYIEENGSEMCHDSGLYDSFDLAEYEERITPGPARYDLSKDLETGHDDEPAKRGKEKDKKKKDEKKKKEDARIPCPGIGRNAAARAALAPISETAEAEAVPEEPQEVKVQEDQLMADAEEFICKICLFHVVGCGPKLTTCSHLFCGDCIQKWIAQHPENQTWAMRAKLSGPERQVPCPVCKQTLNEKKDLYPVCKNMQGENLLLWRMLSSLKIMCANNPKIRPDGLCDWVGEYGTYQAHITTCQNVSLGPSANTVPPAQPVQEALPAPVVEVRAPEPVPAAVEPPPPPPAPQSPQQPPLPPPRAPADQREVQPQRTSPLMPPTPAPQVPATVTAVPLEAPPSEAAEGQRARNYSTPSPYQVPLSPAAAAQPPARNSPLQPPTPAPQVPASVMATPLEAPPSAQADMGYLARAPAGYGAASPYPVVNHQPAVRGERLQPPTPAPQVPATAALRPSNPGVEGHVVRATAVFNATSTYQLSLSPGERVEVIERHTTGWTYGRKAQGSEGWFPDWAVPQVPSAAPVETPPPSPMVSMSPSGQGRMVWATAAFTATSPQQMCLTAGERVEVIERHPTGWTYGRKGNGEGWFPDWAVLPQK